MKIDNYTIANGVKIKRDGDAFTMYREAYDGAIELLANFDVNIMASFFSTMTPFCEHGGSYQYALAFLQGTMFCANCGRPMVGLESVCAITPFACCKECFADKYMKVGIEINGTKYRVTKLVALTEADVLSIAGLPQYHRVAVVNSDRDIEDFNGNSVMPCEGMIFTTGLPRGASA